MIETKYYINNSEKIDFDLETQFHTLKHFITVDNLYKQLLINQTSFNEFDILRQFNEVGSKFLQSFVQNPVNLIETIVQHLALQKEPFCWKNNKCEIKCIFSRNNFPKGIGFDCLFSINKLSETETKRLSKIEKNGFLVNVIKKNPIQTWELNLILYKLENTIKILSIFPGIYAPMFPNQNIQNEKEYIDSCIFWNNHVFLKILE